MKIRNSLGGIVEVPPHMEGIIREYIAGGDHEAVSKLLEGGPIPGDQHLSVPPMNIGGVNNTAVGYNMQDGGNKKFYIPTNEFMNRSNIEHKFDFQETGPYEHTKPYAPLTPIQRDIEMYEQNPKKLEEEYKLDNLSRKYPLDKFDFLQPKLPSKDTIPTSTALISKFGGTPCLECGGSKAEGGVKFPSQEPSSFPLERLQEFVKGLQDVAQPAAIENAHHEALASLTGQSVEDIKKYMKKGGNWIQKAVNPKHKGYSIGDEVDITPEEAISLRAQGYKFDIL